MPLPITAQDIIINRSLIKVIIEKNNRFNLGGTQIESNLFDVIINGHINLSSAFNIARMELKICLQENKI